MIELPFSLTPLQAREYMKSLFESETKFFQQSTIKVCIVNLSFYIPSHDMIMSILMEIRFDKSGSVRTRSFEVLPTQIYVQGNS